MPADNSIDAVPMANFKIKFVNGDKRVYSNDENRVKRPFIVRKDKKVKLFKITFIEDKNHQVEKSQYRY